MTSAVSALRPTPVPTASALRSDRVAQAYTLLRIAFTTAGCWWRAGSPGSS